MQCTFFTASAVPRKGGMHEAKGKDGMRQTALRARSHGRDFPYRHWLTGALTAMNTRIKATVDMRGRTNIDGMLRLLARYYFKQPHHSFSCAVDSK